MPDMSWRRHIGRDIDGGRDDGLVQHGLQTGRIVDAVLQAEDNRVVTETREHVASGGGGVVGFDTEENDIRVGNARGIGRCVSAAVWVAPPISRIRPRSHTAAMCC